MCEWPLSPFLPPSLPRPPFAFSMSNASFLLPSLPPSLPSAPEQTLWSHRALGLAIHPVLPPSLPPSPPPSLSPGTKTLVPPGPLLRGREGGRAWGTALPFLPPCIAPASAGQSESLDENRMDGGGRSSSLSPMAAAEEGERGWEGGREGWREGCVNGRLLLFLTCDDCCRGR